MTAEDIKVALRRRHPATWPGRSDVPGEWVCLEEYANIDLLALNAWAKAQRVGYEIKVTRGDMRRELLSPAKRQRAVDVCHLFYFAVPRGLFTEEELAFKEPESWTYEDFARRNCSNPDCHARPGRSRRRKDKGTNRENASVRVSIPASRDCPANMVRACCAVCKGLGYEEASRVERDAPTLWVPRDVGLIEIVEQTNRRICKVRKAAPLTKAKALVLSNKGLHDLVRWASARPDPRHVARREAYA